MITIELSGWTYWLFILIAVLYLAQQALILYTWYLKRKLNKLTEVSE